MLEVDRLAQVKRQLVFSFLADCARPAVLTVREVFCELVREAGEGEMLVEEVARDGKITATEAKQLRDLFAEMGTEAREGRVV